MRRILAALTLLCVVATGCSNSPNEHEQAACAAAEGLTKAGGRDNLRMLVEAMVTQSDRSENEALEEAARAYQKALGARDVGAAIPAIGQFYDECERLGLDVPGAPG